MHTIRNGVLVALMALAFLVPTGTTQAATNEEMLKMIQSLMAQIEVLQKQLNAVKGDVRDALKDGLREGMTDDDVKKIQQLLGTDPTIYTDGRVTGYFGPLTKEAVRKFQIRHGLEATGVIEGETHELLNEYWAERQNGTIPPGLLRAPGIAKKIEDRYGLKCDNRGHGNDVLCKRYKKAGVPIPPPQAPKEDFDIDVRIESGETTLEFTFDDEDYEVSVNGTDIDDLLDEVADELNEDVDDLSDDLVKEIEDAFDDEKSSYDDDLAEFDVDVSIENGTTTVEFEYDNDDYEVTVNGTDEDDILEAIADELDEDDVDDLDEDLVEAVKEALDDEEDGDTTDWDNVEVEVENDETALSFEYDGDDYDVAVDSTDEDDVLEAVADEIGDDVDDLNEDFVDEIKDLLEEAIDDAEDGEAESDAEDAIDDAEDAIDDAETAIDDASGDTSDAEDLLDEAKELLEDAEDAFDDEDWEEAEDLANDAEDRARDAQDEV